MSIGAGRVEPTRLRRTLAVRDAAFDKAMAINSVQVWPDAVAGLREIRRVLSPGGRIALGFTRHSGKAKEGATEMLQRLGSNTCGSRT
jgi:ubiquinone/menaquinone biosynthesis C-methylase UbiE